MSIKFGDSEEAWMGFDRQLKVLIGKFNAKRVLEIGGGANPSLDWDYIQKNRLDFTILDISDEELRKAPSEFKKIRADIGKPLNQLNDPKYDIVFSKMLAEHIKDGYIFHKNVYDLLTVGGIAFHFFPTLYAFPFLLNRLLPASLSTLILKIFQKGRENSGKHGKFPAYYSWCRGPLKKQISSFERLGFQVEEYIGFYGHQGYYDKFPFLKNISDMITKYLIENPIPMLTSFAYVVLKKTSKDSIDNKRN